MNPIMRKSMSTLVIQPSFRALGQMQVKWQTFEKPENKRQMYGSQSTQTSLVFLQIPACFYISTQHADKCFISLMLFSGVAYPAEHVAEGSRRHCRQSEPTERWSAAQCCYGAALLTTGQCWLILLHCQENKRQIFSALYALWTMWLKFACPTNQHPKSTIKEKKATNLCAPREFKKIMKALNNNGYHQKNEPTIFLPSGVHH